MSRHGTMRPAAWLVLPLAAAVAAAAGWAIGPQLGTGTKLFPLAVLGVAGVIGLIAAVTVLDPAWVLSAGLGLSIFSGNWSYMHIPGPLDRVVVLTGVAAVILRSAFDPEYPKLRSRPVHWLLALIVLYAVASAAAANTLHQHAAVFELLDRLGAVPFLLYLVGPVAFATARQRSILLWTLVLIGAYLGLTAVFEMIGPHALIFPSYIANPALGLHDGRARGPFLEAGADGLAMFVSAVAATILLGQVREAGRRRMLIAVIALCLLGIVLSLTRQVWLGSAVGAIAAASLSPRLRRLIPIGALIVALGVGGALVLVPNLRAELGGRASAQKPVWDRLNSDAAALRMIEARPALGFGWGSFPVSSPRYYHVAGSYPLSSVPEVHNVVLSNAAELGIVGLALWLAAVIEVMTAPLRRRGPPSLAAWRLGLVAVAIAWFVQANFTPLSYAFDNYMPWLFAGVALGLAPVRERVRVPALWARPALS